jgi:hypothetical protein
MKSSEKLGLASADDPGQKGYQITNGHVPVSDFSEASCVRVPFVWG